MMRALLIRGMLVGLVAGLLAFGVAKTLGEPQINKAIAFEDHIGQLNHEPPDAAMVSRAVQASAGLGTGTILFGVAFGGLFALAFAIAHGRIGTQTPRGTALLLGGLALVSCYLVPNLKYPANPPSIGFPDTITRRTNLYLAMLLLGVLTMVVAVGARKLLAHRFGEWNGTIIAGLGFVVLVGICYVALPGINEVPQQAMPGVAKFVSPHDQTLTFPPVLLWRFRVASLAIQTVLWSAIGLGFGALAERVYRVHGEAPATNAPTGSLATPVAP